jgi:hypothetical protein
MIKDIFNNYGTYIYIAIGVIIAIIVILLIFRGKKAKVVEEVSSSILDVNIDGVIDKDFEYGYEKQDTVIMKKKDLKEKKKKK